MEWKNGKPKRVVVAKGSVWAVLIQNEHGATLIDDTGQPEESYPYPGNRRKTIAQAKMIAKAHGVNVYEYSRDRGYVLI